jgi:uncharacterized RDD family membrane protein YckC
MSGPSVTDEDFIDGVMSRRIFAWLIDLLLICLIMTPFLLMFSVFTVVTLGLGAGVWAIVPVIPFLYHFLSLLRRKSATPGQAMMGLTVRRDDDLGPPTGLQALIFVAIFYVTMATSGLLLLIALVTPRHRTLHDLASDLVVVRRRALEAWTA